MRFLSLFAPILLLITGSAVAQSSTPVDPANPPPPLSAEFGPQPSVPDGLDISPGSPLLQPGWSHVQDEMLGDREGAFRFSCPVMKVGYSDPIVYPGQPGKSPHSHAFFGNEQSDKLAGYYAARTTGLSSCNNQLWRSRYWLPSMFVFKADGTSVEKVPETIAVYYKRPAKRLVECTPGNPAYIGRCVPFPNGLKAIAGVDLLTNTIPTGVVNFNCLVYTDQNSGGYQAEGGGQRTDMLTAMSICPTPPPGDTNPRTYLDIRFEFPSCWDGVHLDSPNHRSHLANFVDRNNVAVCPADHPYHIWRYTAQVFYRVDNDLPRDGLWWNGRPGWYLSSDRMYGRPMQRPGSTAHFDVADAANTDIKKIIEDNCIEKMYSCSGGDLGNGYMLKPTYNYNLGLDKPTIPRAAAANEPATVRLHPPL